MRAAQRGGMEEAWVLPGCILISREETAAGGGRRSDWAGMMGRLSLTERSGLERSPLGCSHLPGVSIDAPRGGSHLLLSVSRRCIFWLRAAGGRFLFAPQGDLALIL